MSSSSFPLSGDGRPVSRQALKIGENPQKTVVDGGKHSVNTWKREMEQAQRAMWFKPQNTSSRTNERYENAATSETQGTTNTRQPALLTKVSVAGMTAPHGSGFSGSMPNHATVMQEPVSIDARVHRFEPSLGPVADMRVATLAFGLARVAHLKVRTLTQSQLGASEIAVDAWAAALESEERMQGPAPDQETLRLHAEWQGQDVTVWLGISARPEIRDDQIEKFLPQLRACLQGQRSKLVKLICNGHTVFEISSSSFSSALYFTHPKESP